MAEARILYLPVEIQAREFVGKVLLASKATERGWQVVLGDMPSVDKAVRAGRPGVFFEISINRKKAKRLSYYKSRGHMTANLCEEAVVYHNGYDYCERKVSPAALHHTDLMLTVGERNRQHLHEFRPDSDPKIALTGNPRFDTLLPGLRSVYEADAARIREQYGRFVLINTNFSLVNHQRHSATEMLERFKRSAGAVDGKHTDMLRRWFDYKAEQMRQFTSLLSKLAQSRNFDNIIVRPHPSENHKMWSDFGRPLDIKTIFHGNANSWMLAADAVLHTGCTTGIEGLLMGRPVASFITDPNHDMVNQSDQVSVQIGSCDEFLSHTRSWRGWEDDEIQSSLTPQREALGSMIANIDQPLASDSILDAIEPLDVPASDNGVIEARRFPSLPSWVRRSSGKKPSQLHRQKLPGFDRNDITSLTETWVKADVLKKSPKIIPGPGDTLLIS